MKSTLHITEPHPSLPSSRVLFSGRGGAGNAARYTRASLTDGQTATGPASRLTSIASATRQSTSPPPTSLAQTSTTNANATSQRKQRSTGRGGAGNFSSKSTLTGTPRSSYPALPALFNPTSTAPRHDDTTHSEPQIFSFDEELERQLRLREGAAPVFMVGRGGAGNACAAPPSSSSRSTRSSRSSASDVESTHSTSSARRAGARPLWRPTSGSSTESNSAGEDAAHEDIGRGRRALERLGFGLVKRF